METFFEAVESNDFLKVKDLLRDGVEDVKDIDLGHLVEFVNDAEMLRTIFYECGKETGDYLKKSQLYILYCAISVDKDVSIIEVIVNLDKGCINRNLLGEMAPLLMAVSLNRDVRLVKFLLKNNADVNYCKLNGEAPLHLAKKSEIVKLLIENGADINSADNEGLTPIMSAIKDKQDNEVILEFIKNGADLVVRCIHGHTCLHLALFWKYDEEVIDMICSKTPDYNLEDNGGVTPLCCALDDCEQSKWYSTNFIHKLINKCFQVDTFVFMYSLVRCVNVDLIISLANYVDLKFVDMTGNSFLHYAHHPRLISMLVRKGVFINHKNIFGRTPLMEAIIRHESDEVVESLLFWGSDIKKSSCIFDVVYRKRRKIRMSSYDLLVLYGLSVSIKNMWVKRYVFRKLNCIKNQTVIDPMNFILLGHIYLSNDSLTLPEDLLTNPNVNGLIEVYSTELNKMKNETFTDQISYYDFCRKHYRYMRCPFVDKGLTEADYENIKTLFPLFYDEVFVKIKINIKIHKRIALLRKLDKVSLSKQRESGDNDEDSSCAYVKLNHDSMYILASFMHDREISCLLAAAVI